MWTRNQRQGAARLFLRRLGLLVLLAVALTAASGVWGVYKKERESAKQRAEAENNRADLEARQAQIEADIAELRTDRGVEEALREQYALAEQGEGLIVIVDPEVPQPAQATTTVMEKIRDFLWFW